MKIIKQCGHIWESTTQIDSAILLCELQETNALFLCERSMANLFFLIFGTNILNRISQASLS